MPPAFLRIINARMKRFVLPRSSPRWRLIGLYEKSVGVCIGYRPTVRGFSHCPLNVGRQREALRLYMQRKHTALIPHGILSRCRNYISTGIHRCSILDIQMNFARIPDSQESARINAFHYVCIPPSTHNRGFKAGCKCKVITNFNNFHKIKPKRFDFSQNLRQRGVTAGGTAERFSSKCTKKGS